MFPENCGQKSEIFLPLLISYNIIVLRTWVLRQTVSLPVLTTTCVYKTIYMVSIEDFSKDHQKSLQSYLGLNDLKSFLDQVKG